ncbi:MAG: GAF domain-containing protein [Chloroflexota bacterium]
MSIIRKLWGVSVTDPDYERRRGLLDIVLLGLAVVAILALLATTWAWLRGIEQDYGDLYGGSLGLLFGLGVIFAISRLMSGRLASWLLLVLLILVSAFSDSPEQVVDGRTLFVFAIPILMSSALLRPWSSFVVAGLVSLVLLAVGLSVGMAPNVIAFLSFFMLALVSWLTGRSLERALQRLQQRNRELILLSSAVQTLNSSLDIDQILVNVLEEVRRIMGVMSCSVWLVDPQSGELVCQQSAGPGHEIVRGWRLSPQQGIVGWVMRQGQSLCVPDTRLDERHFEDVDRQTGVELRSLLSVPLPAREKVVGVLQVGDVQVDRFEPSDLVLIESLAASAAIAVENARLLQATRQRAEQLESLRQAGLKLTASLKLQVVLEAILEQVLRMVAAHDAHIFLYDGQRLTFGAALWADERQTQPYTEVRSDGLTYTVARSGECIVVPNANEHPLFSDWPWGGGIIGMPLKFGGRVVGVMNVAFLEPHAFSRDELRGLELLADQATVAIENARLYGQVAHHADELEKRVAERTRELTEAYERLKELDRLKTKFVSDVSHELRTPVTNIGLYLHLLERGAAQNRPEYLRVLREQSDRLGGLVQDILNLSRLEVTKEEVQFEAVDLNVLVEQVVIAEQARAEAKGLSLVFEPDPTLPPVRGAATQLGQVITNLIANAINYTVVGRVCVRTGRDEARSGGGWLEVEDSGMGISPEDLPHIFERFYRGREVGSSNLPGTGLGLAIVQEIVALHGGQIDVDSRPGQGSRFRVFLPLMEQDADE